MKIHLTLSIFILLFAGCDKSAKKDSGSGSASKPDTLASNDPTDEGEIGDYAGYPQRPTGWFLYDSSTIIDSLIEAEPLTGPENVLKTDYWESFMLGNRGGTNFDSLLYEEGCTLEAIHYRKYPEGIEELSRDDSPDEILFRGDTLRRFGLHSGDSLSEVVTAYGVPRKMNPAIALYVTDQPDPDQLSYFENKWKLYFLFENGKLRGLMARKFFDDC